MLNEAASYASSARGVLQKVRKRFPRMDHANELWPFEPYVHSYYIFYYHYSVFSFVLIFFNFDILKCVFLYYPSRDLTCQRHTRRTSTELQAVSTNSKAPTILGASRPWALLGDVLGLSWLEDYILRNNCLPLAYLPSIPLVKRNQVQYETWLASFGITRVKTFG